MDKELYFISIVLAVIAVLVVAIGYASNNEKVTTDDSTVAEPATIETNIPLSKIVCTSMTSDGCFEYVIYRTVKE